MSSFNLSPAELIHRTLDTIHHNRRRWMRTSDPVLKEKIRDDIRHQINLAKNLKKFSKGFI